MGAPGESVSFIEQARRAQIERAAIEVIADHGYSGATFARIAERAGVSPSLISYHFTSKQDLMSAVVAGITGRLDRALTDATEDAPTYSAALRSLIEAHVGFTSGNSADAAALMHIYSSGSEATDLLPTDAQRDGWVDELASMIAEGQAEGEFAEFDPRPVAVTLLAALNAAPAELRRHPEIDADAFTRELADMFEVVTTTRRRRGGRR